MANPKAPPADIAIPRAFLITPLGTGQQRRVADNVYRAVRDVCEQYGFRCERDVETKSADEFTQTIRRMIRWSHIVICDLSRNRPNCYYELGYAEALERPVILMCNNKTEIHSDLKGRQFFIYKSIADIQRNLGARLRDCAALHNTERASEVDELYGQGGGRAFSRNHLLTAHVVADEREDSEAWFTAFARVENVKGRPISDSVVFRFEGSFSQRRRTIKPKAGVAAIEIGQVWGATTIVAEIPSKKIKLELNLRYVPGSNPTFRYE